MRPDQTGGFILDSGSPHSVLVQTAYKVVKEKIIEYFERYYSCHPLPPQPGDLDLCYDMPHQNFTAPSMTYHFEGANLFLPQRNVSQFFDASFCLMVMPINDRGPNILGAFQQMNHRFFFDFTALTAAFVPERCRFNRE
ncbi:hypothetical protein ACJRO7_032933 [Eucalyptus globulus]|uniref:Peptidase A1 domain-containing protein n=1 Tax=Eucalyptus globulus TaxID=34317 RepID=A0ABD3JVA8_EUCGL